MWPVQHQVAAAPAADGGDQVGLFGVGRDGADGEPGLLERATDEGGAGACIAGRVAGVDAGEGLEEGNQGGLVLLDPGEQPVGTHAGCNRVGAVAVWTVVPPWTTARTGLWAMR